MTSSGVPARSDSQRPSPWQTSLAATLLLVSVFVVYGNSLHVPFVFDDEVAIVTNTSLHQVSTALSPSQELAGTPVAGRPLLNLSFAANHALGGLNVTGYHVVNILVHGANALLLFGLVRRTLLQPGLARAFGADAWVLGLAVAWLWALHPLQTESVTYVSQRAESLVSGFLLLTLYAFVRGATSPGPAWRWQAIAIGACAAGMLTKEVMVAAPLCAALYARAFLAGSWRETFRRHRTVLAGVAATWLILGAILVIEQGGRGSSAGLNRGVSSVTYLLTQCEALCRYAKLALWPHPLVLDYGTHLVADVSAVVLPGLAVVAVLGVTLWAWQRHAAVAWPLTAAFLILAPSSSFVPVISQTMAEHRVYLPSAALIGLGVLGVYLTLGRRILLIFVIAVGCGLGALTVQRNTAYETPIRIYTDTVTKRPGNARAMALLGDYLQRAGRMPEARTWLERSLEIEPGVIPVLLNLADVYQRMGESEKGLVSLQTAYAKRPHDPKVLNNLGIALVAAGQPSAGIERLKEAVRLEPTSTVTRNNLGSTLARLGRMPEAADQFRECVRLRPRDSELRSTYADALTALGQFAQAAEELTAAVRLAPSNDDLHNRLGIALGRSGQLPAALLEFQEALRLNPNNTNARQNAAVATRRLQIR